jgi:hypothetical protein
MRIKEAQKHTGPTDPDPDPDPQPCEKLMDTCDEQGVGINVDLGDLSQ